MADIQKDLLLLIAKYEKQCLEIDKKIEDLTAQKRKAEQGIVQLSKIAGVDCQSDFDTPQIDNRKRGKQTKFCDFVKAEFYGISLVEAIKSVLLKKGSQSRRQVAEAIAIDDLVAIQKIMQAIRNRQRYSDFQENFVTKNVRPSEIDSRPIQIISLKQQPKPLQQKDIFSDLGDFLERAEKKHYPKKAIVNQEKTA